MLEGLAMFWLEAFCKIQTPCAFLIFTLIDYVVCWLRSVWELVGKERRCVCYWNLQKDGGHAGVRSSSRHDANTLVIISWSSGRFLMLLLLRRKSNPCSLDDLFEDAHAEPEADALRYSYA